MPYSFRDILAGLFVFAAAIILGWASLRFIWNAHPVGEASRSIMGVSIARDTAGGQMVSSASGGYRFALPRLWKAEPIGADGVSVYPPNPASASLRCKLQLSVFENPGRRPFKEWLAMRLREDPTVAIEQTSLEGMTVAGGHGVRWTGSVDGRRMILVYVDVGMKIYEVAPSSLDPNDIASDACAGYLDEFLTLLHFST